MFKIGDYVVLDIETTGLSRHRHSITEIAAVRLRRGKVVEEFQTLVNPECRIPRFITRLTGIDNEMVKDAPTINKVMPKFLKFLGDGVVVAHSATFDYGFLHVNAYEHTGKGLSNEKLCTRKLANRMLPDLGSKRLGNVCEHLGVVNEQAHRAMGDVRATTKVFVQFLEMLGEKGLVEHEDISRFECTPKRKCLEILGLDDI